MYGLESSLLLYTLQQSQSVDPQLGLEGHSMKAELAKPGWRTHLCLYARIHSGGAPTDHGGGRTMATLGFLKVVEFFRKADAKYTSLFRLSRLSVHPFVLRASQKKFPLKSPWDHPDPRGRSLWLTPVERGQGLPRARFR